MVKVNGSGSAQRLAHCGGVAQQPGIPATKGAVIFYREGGPCVCNFLGWSKGGPVLFQWAKGGSSF